MGEPTQPLTPAPLPPEDHAYDWFANLLLLGTFGFLALTFWKEPKLPGDVVGVVIGYLFAQIQTITGFKWGGSAGSERKNAIIKTMADKVGA